ncbi:MAG: DEAD/DEAH box helicase [Nitratireductor sp.]
MTTFEALGLSPSILRSLSALGFDKPTPIQSQAIPLLLQGHDLLGLAQTGTGKTAAFGLPLVQQLAADGSKPVPKSVRSLILAPTRELVNQIAANLRSYVRGTPLKINLVVGGASINVQCRNLERGTDILVATPGRLLDLVERRAVFLDSARFLVLDEADQMLDLGFIHALRQISKLVGQPRQTMLFSATMPKQIEDLGRAYLTDPVRVEVSPPGKAVDKIRQSVHFVNQRGKAELLRNLLANNPDDLSLVFARTKHGAEKLMKFLVESGYPSASIHGNKSQPQREKALRSFRNGEVRVLVATDVAARGIDIPGVSHVYNFDLPEVPENYVHRIGRTGRAGADGEAVAFCSPDENRMLRDIERLMGISVAVASGERGGRGDHSSAPAKAKRGGNGRQRERQQLTVAPEMVLDGDVRSGRRDGPYREQRGNGGGRKQSRGENRSEGRVEGRARSEFHGKPDRSENRGRTDSRGEPRGDSRAENRGGQRGESRNEFRGKGRGRGHSEFRADFKGEGYSDVRGNGEKREFRDGDTPRKHNQRPGRNPAAKQGEGGNFRNKSTAAAKPANANSAPKKRRMRKRFAAA